MFRNLPLFLVLSKNPVQNSQGHHIAFDFSDCLIDYILKNNI